jgi:predicted ArsR family transcriptional regulator
LDPIGYAPDRKQAAVDGAWAAVTLPAGRTTEITGVTQALEAVGHPVRLRILRRLGEGPASVPELAEAAGVHENTVRAHVAVLESGGLVSSAPRPAAGRGRPGVEYELTHSGERLDVDFLGLAELLAAVIERTGTTPEQLRDVGREWGRYLLGRPGRYDVDERIPEVLRRLGFDARVAGGRVELTGCPCPLIAPDRPELICELATGVLDGVLSAAGTHQTVGDGHHNPAERRCHVTLIDVSPRS